jgi:3-polyprenyl-4-hydroxybenzoate decarboxylase
MSYRDLRGWVEAVDGFGELKRINGVDWNLEMGAITEVFARKQPYPAILFDEIRGYPPGHRLLVGVHHQSLKKQCLTTHLPLDYDSRQFITAWK